MTDVLIIGIVALALLVADHVWSSLLFRRALRETLSIAEQTLLLADRNHERASIQIAELLDRLMAQDFTTYKEQKEIELSEGGFVSPDLEEEGGIERPGPFPHAVREDDLEDTQILSEQAILEEDFDMATGEPRRAE